LGVEFGKYAGIQECRNEKKSGEELGYFENGQLAYKRIYKNGKRARELFYEEGGKLREEKKYDEDGFFIY
jgi:antitoxin component YwqK of YwqJK toxin-antitoxin module